MKIAIVTFDGFNEIDSFVALSILNRVKLPEWKAQICSSNNTVESMNGVKVEVQKPLSFANEADAVLFGSGSNTKNIVHEESVMSLLELSPEKQLIGAQCSGALFLHHLGLIDNLLICTDKNTRPYLEALGVSVTERAFKQNGNIATAGGCLSSHYLAMWVIYRALNINEAKEQIRYVAPVGQENEYISRAEKTVIGA